MEKVECIVYGFIGDESVQTLSSAQQEKNRIAYAKIVGYLKAQSVEQFPSEEEVYSVLKLLRRSIMY
jgi:hypothetical protein